MVTEIILTFNGTNEKFQVSDYLNNESKENGVWNTAEQVIYPADDISGLLVEVTVIDLDSNSLVMMGTLQNK